MNPLSDFDLVPPEGLQDILDLAVVTPEGLQSILDETLMVPGGNDQIFDQNYAFAKQLGMAEDDRSVTLSPNTSRSPGTPYFPKIIEVEAAAEPEKPEQPEQLEQPDQIEPYQKNLISVPDFDLDLDAILSAAAFAQSPQPQQVQPKKPLRPSFPVNPFLSLSRKDQKNVEAARTILSMIKVLAINENLRGGRYTLISERNAILSMSVNYTLNVQPNVQRTNSQQLFSSLLKRAFSTFDHDTINREGVAERSNYGRIRFKDSFERAFLLVAVRLLRHKFMYEPEEGTANHYSSDFEALLPKSSMCKNKRLFMKRTKDLCRIIIACGHPCIVLILVRIAIRRGLRFVELLDRLPVQQFCQFLSTGQVCLTNLHSGPPIPKNRSLPANSGHQLESNLLYAREHILMPLLCIASQRIPQTFFMFDDTRVPFNVQACLTAIVPHTFQSRYAVFLKGEVQHDAWQAGEVEVETFSHVTSNNVRIASTSNQHDSDEISDPSDDEHSIGETQSREAEYSIRKDKRTFHNFNYAKYSNIQEVIQNPPAFLKNKVLNMSADD
ncbi:uncharacterized protein FA14DRAFT_179113 [Meira miltonrushii]|uniref:Uncharacterized protein n=1 Tax=Meira miltonrushii TaxID=1280837 RepID=A0A316VJR3_9BASI|nr:uncharacterized protein FA14DRAFT_179113 [Meira miltonrushii]PWN35745.1 hypothetical protein FA14DRAFT_179113 [Meira miltonrushii]